MVIFNMLGNATDKAYARCHLAVIAAAWCGNLYLGIQLGS